jgi:hypothetical protein
MRIILLFFVLILNLPLASNAQVVDENYDRLSTILILKQLHKENIPKLAVEKWYNRQADGSMDLRLLHKRGRYNADDYDSSLAQLIKRVNTNLKYYGNKLINKTYVILSEIHDIERARDRKKSKTHGYSADNHLI